MERGVEWGMGPHSGGVGGIRGGAPDPGWQRLIQVAAFLFITTTSSFLVSSFDPYDRHRVLDSVFLPTALSIRYANHDQELSKGQLAAEKAELERERAKLAAEKAALEKEKARQQQEAKGQQKGPFGLPFAFGGA